MCSFLEITSKRTSPILSIKMESNSPLTILQTLSDINWQRQSEKDLTQLIVFWLALKAMSQDFTGLITSGQLWSCQKQLMAMLNF